MYWILDGYNIILADEKLSKMARNNLEYARDALAQEILSSERFRRQNVSLVFDGRSGGSSEKIASNLEIKFSKSTESADDLIKSMIGNFKSRSSVFIVSNDLSIVNYAKECAANVSSSRDFLSLIRVGKNNTKEDGSSSEKPSVPGKSDFELLRLFKEKNR